METEALGAAQTIDFSLWGMFIRSTPVIKLVTIGLVFASFLVWAVVIDKWLEFRRVKRDLQMFEDAFWSGQPLDARLVADQRRPQPQPAVEDHAEIGVRITAVELGGPEQGVDGRGPPAALERSGKQVVLPAQRKRAHRSLGGVVVLAGAAVEQHRRQRSPLRERVTDRLRKLFVYAPPNLFILCRFCLLR